MKCPSQEVLVLPVRRMIHKLFFATNVGVFTKYLPNSNCQRARRANMRGLRGGQVNAARSSAAGRKILDRAVNSVR